MADKNENYFIGLDCGTSSVGWAVTDRDYNLLRARGQTLWGVRLFDEANTAEERRTARSARRRIRRSNDRIKLLDFLFKDEMAKIDPEFYLRLKKSFLLEEDKNLKQNSKNTLFNDKNYKDKDFHKAYPTIWHLRHAIIAADENTHFDLRHYYLAIHHILKNRGHFLRNEKVINGAGNFEELFIEFCDLCENFGIKISDSSQEVLEEIVSNKKKDAQSRKLGKKDKQKLIAESIFIENSESEEEDPKEYKKRCLALAGLLIGSSVKPLIIFRNDLTDEEKNTSFSFDASNIEEKLASLEALLDSDEFALIESAKKIYDYGYLSELLSGAVFVSEAMVKNYNLHQAQLKELKALLKNYEEDYNTFFKTKEVEKDNSNGCKPICYNAYIGKAYSRKGDRESTLKIGQETINKEIERLLEKYAPDSELLPLAKEGRLLPKQKGQAKGTIPQQLHHAELEIVLKHLEKDFPSFAKKTDEPEEYNTTSKKIASIHSFRIPYYCGPINTKNDRHWADDEIAELVRPWNFHQLVDMPGRANEFIKHMTNKCTYLPVEDVLPKHSLLYQKYIVLNELNNLKIDGKRIDLETKKKIYSHVFESGELQGNITIKQLSNWLRSNGFISAGSELSGSAESKFLPKLSTHQDFKNIFGEDYQKRFKATDLEEAINLITILNNEPKMLRKKLAETLGLSETNTAIIKLSKKSYKDWARFSERFLTGIKIEKDGRQVSIMDMLEDGTENLMELLSSKYHFVDKIEEENNLKNPPKTEITYEDVKNLYCSPSVKRSIWQAIKIVDELVKIKGSAPEKIFLESTREDDASRKKSESLSRHSKLMENYHNLTKSEEAQELLAELKSKEPRDLQQKKLYLYFTQMGRCAYSGERIEIEDLQTSAYDIDHIFPRSKTKDDSITRNLVLVKAEYNREKTNIYPIEEKWRTRMAGKWFAWYKAGLITKEKLDRLTRTTPLTAEELSKFIARQIVETAQSVKVLRGLFQQKYPNTKIVLVKAGQVSDLRHYFANGYKDKETGEIIVPGRPEFIKLRALNDLHHAKDAYLNIIVGNVMSETFTDNPIKWLNRDNNIDTYSLNSHNIWRRSPKDGIYIKGWHYKNTIEIMSKNLAKNNILWTRMVHNQTGAISDLMPVGKSKKCDGILPLKKNLDPKKYGGYNSIKGSHFMLIEESNKKGKKIRRIVSIPILARNNSNKYINPNATIIIPEIKYKSLLEINGKSFTIRGNNSILDLKIISDAQIYLPISENPQLKNICNLNAKITKNKNYKLDPEKDGVTPESNIALYDIIFDKVKELYGYTPKPSKQDFANINIIEQCKIIEAVLIAGRCTISKNLENVDRISLILQSPTGLFERKIDLKTCPPQTLNQKEA